MAEVQSKTQARRTGKPFSFVVIQKAGLDYFWLHQRLKAEGIESGIVGCSDAPSFTTLNMVEIEIGVLRSQCLDAASTAKTR